MSAAVATKPPTGVDLYARFAFAGAVCCAVTHGALTPVDVVKTRIQLEPQKYNQGMVPAFRKIIAEEGAGALLTGVGPTFAGYFVQGAFKFGGYEFWKKQAINYFGYDKAVEIRIPIYLGSSAIAEFFADVALCPLEATRIRLVSQPSFATGLVASIGVASLATYAFSKFQNREDEEGVKVSSLCEVAHAASDKVPHYGAPGTKKERTFIAVKPDGVHRNLVGQIIHRFEAKGYKLVGIKVLVPSKQHAEKHYSDLSSRPFFPGLVKYFSSGPVVAMVWEGKNVIAGGRKLVGATDPNSAEPGSIRGDLCIAIGRNIIHGSDSPDSAKAEISLWFKEDEVADYELGLDKWVYEN